MQQSRTVAINKLYHLTKSLHNKTAFLSFNIPLTNNELETAEYYTNQYPHGSKIRINNPTYPLPNKNLPAAAKQQIKKLRYKYKKGQKLKYNPTRHTKIVFLNELATTQDHNNPTFMAICQNKPFTLPKLQRRSANNDQSNLLKPRYLKINPRIKKGTLVCCAPFATALKEQRNSYSKGTSIRDRIAAGTKHLDPEASPLGFPTVGIDINTKNVIALSNGKIFRLPKYIEIIISKIKRLNSAIKKKKQKAKPITDLVNGRTKLRIKLKRQIILWYRNIAKCICHNYAYIFYERQPPSKRNNKIFYRRTFINELKRQAILFGRYILGIQPTPGNTNICWLCNSKLKHLNKHERKKLESNNHLKCFCDGIVHRDINAARNVRQKGIEITEQKLLQKPETKELALHKPDIDKDIDQIRPLRQPIIITSHQDSLVGSGSRAPTMRRIKRAITKTKVTTSALNKLQAAKVPRNPKALMPDVHNKTHLIIKPRDG